MHSPKYQGVYDMHVN